MADVKTTEPSNFNWSPVMGRCLAALALNASPYAERPIVEKAEYLMALGVPRPDAAIILGSTDNSLRVMLQKRKSGPKK